jgi:hypothetical protein
MPVIGFRCHKDALACVVLDGSVDEPQLLEQHFIRMPKAERAEQLVWLRQEIQEIIQRTTPSAVAFKSAEAIARRKDLGRAETEGVLQEAVRASGLLPHRRVWSQIKADLHFPKAARYLPSLLTGPLGTLPANRREAALAALAAFAHA